MLTLVVATSVLGTSPPAVTLFESTSNVFARAFPSRDVGVVRFLGTFNTTADCSQACVGYTSDVDGAICHSFSFHHADFPSAQFAGACFAVADHSWQPNSPADKITSGRVAWPMEGCGDGAVHGCLWQTDPVCLNAGGDLTPQPVQLTVSEAVARCGSTAECVGFTFSGLANASGPVSVRLRNQTDEVHGGGSGCWSWRKFFKIADDPYRTAYHFQPSQSWMNDPDGPMHTANGLYHLFWQWNPTADVGFSNMHWGHAISHDLLGWHQEPIALYPDAGSCGGEWSGSATLNAPFDGPVLSYAVQCNSYFGQAYPDDPTDPLLLNWTANHVVGHKAPGTGGFRDPSTAWKGADGVWRQILACNGASCLYNSSDFKSWAYVGHMAGTAVGSTWECPDLFPLPGAANPDTLFFKVGMENGTDYYWVGTFDEATNVFSDANGRVNYSVPSQQCDYGMFYASKSFADAAADAPRLLIGWVGEAAGGPLREWEGIQSTPRSVVADPHHPGRVLFQPLPALVSLREGGSRVALPPATLAPGSAAPVNGLSGVQLDCVANFTLPLAPSAFGLSVFVGEGFSLNVTLHVGDVAGWANLTVGPHTGPFPLPSSGPIMLRVLVDHSVVEAFAADGRAVITHRVYPPDGAVGVQVLNSGAAAVQLGGFEGYTMRTPSKPSLDELRAKAASRARATAGRE